MRTDLNPAVLCVIDCAALDRLSNVSYIPYPVKMMKNMSSGVPKLFKGGTQHLSGLEQAVLRNVEACEDLAHITRTSLGPNGTISHSLKHATGSCVLVTDAWLCRHEQNGD